MPTRPRSRACRRISRPSPIRAPTLYSSDHVAFPFFVRRLAPSLVHIPLNRVPLFMQEPYVVTIHDMSSLLFETGSGLRIAGRRFLLRRGLLRARRILAVSEATRRDVHDALGIPADRIRLAHNAPNPDFFRPAPAERARSILERYQIAYPFLLYAGNIRPQKNIPRLVEAFAVAREHLSRHPVYRAPAPHHHRRRDFALSLGAPRRHSDARRKGCAFSRIRALRSLARFF